MKRKQVANYALYLVTDRRLIGTRQLISCIEEAILGGITMLQLREKSISTLEFYEVAGRVKQIAQQYQIPYLINDRLDIALAVDADGLHIGQEDLPVAQARRLLGPDKILGVSAATVEQAVAAEQQGADYLGVGAVFSTSTKMDAKTVSLDTLKQIKQSVSIPVVGIGGIHAANVEQAMHCGIDGVSVISAILAKENVRDAAEKMRTLVDRSIVC